MKIILTMVAFLFVCANSYALNLGDSLKQIGEGSSKQINKNIDKKLDKIVKKFEGKIDGKISKYTAKIAEAEKSIDQLLNIKAKAEGYIKMAKIVLAVLSSGILVLIFVMWRIWRNIVTMKKVFKNVANYQDIEARLKKVEKAVARG